MIINEALDTMVNSPIRVLEGKVELRRGSTLLATYTGSDKIQEFSITRTGKANKFFGYSICQELKLELTNRENDIDIKKGDVCKVFIGDETNMITTFPLFTVEKIEKDENTNNLTIYAECAIYTASNHTVAELILTLPYTVKQMAQEIAKLLNVSIRAELPQFELSYPEGANLNGDETLRDLLDAMAELSGSICFVNANNEIEFKVLDVAGTAVKAIDNSQYFTLSSEDTKVLGSLILGNELGDNIKVGTGEPQIIRSNPFLDLREDKVDILNTIFNSVNGLSITPFECKWRGNFLIELGDKITFTNVNAYMLNDVSTYNGGYKQLTKIEFEENKSDTPANPTNIGEAINQTVATVDKVKKEITLMAGQVDENSKNVSSLILNTKSINASVEELKKGTQEQIDGVQTQVDEVNKRVDLVMSAEDVKIEIQNQLSNGVDKVKTATGFTFDQNGLTVSKSQNDITTKITEDGMRVYREGQEVLTADNQGVKAEDLHATTYLIIGKYSRLEDFGQKTACFWLGPQ